jgi:hypothetical protein
MEKNFTNESKQQWAIWGGSNQIYKFEDPTINESINATTYAVPAYVQHACKNTITPDMYDLSNPDRMYNLFTAGGVKPTRAAHIWDEMTDSWSADETLNMSEVWVWNGKTNRTEYVPPTCFIPAPDNQVCLWNQLKEDIMFDILGALSNSAGWNHFLTAFSLVALVIYFITSSDSGSLIVDITAANGHEEPPVLQRVFWAFTEGATAIALLYAGRHVDGPFGDMGEGGLRALQAASIIMGLPYTFIVFWMSQALVQVCREEAGELDAERPRFKMFLISLPRSKKVDMGQGFLWLLRAAVCPGISPAMLTATKSWPLGQITGGYFPSMLIMFTTFYAAILMCFLGFVDYNIMIFGQVLYLGFAFFVSLVRREIRSQWGIPRGDFVSDMLYTYFFFPFVLVQLEIEMKEPQPGKGFSSV